MKRLWILALAATLCGCAGGHGSVRQLNPDPEGESFPLGKDLFEARNYSEAVLELKSYLDGNPAGAHAEDASWMLGLSYGRRGDWASAEVELRNFVDRYPGSSHLPEVEYTLAEAYWHDARPPAYDQEKTLYTRDQLNRVLVLYPDSPYAADARKLMVLVRDRLAEREVINARLYLKLHQPRAVVMHASRVAQEYPESQWLAEALFLEGEGFTLLKSPESARAAWTRLVKASPDSEWADKARDRLQELSPARP